MSPHELLAATGALPWKPIFAALMLPPLPLIALGLVGAACIARRRTRSGWALLLAGLGGIWLSQCQAVGEALEQALLSPPPALSPPDLAALRQTAGTTRRVVVVLGGGREVPAPEYGQGHLSLRSAQRLHYALYLARRIDAPVMYSGGAGFAEASGESEAEIAARIAERDFAQPLRWLEPASRDTRENARLSMAMLESAGGVDEIVLVSQGWHLPRALRAFHDVAARWAAPPKLIAAPVGNGGGGMRPTLRWLPSPDGAQRVHAVLRECLGLMLGA